MTVASATPGAGRVPIAGSGGKLDAGYIPSGATGAALLAAATQADARTSIGLGALATASTVTSSQISDASTAGRSLLTAADAAAARSAIGAGTGNGTVTGVTATAPVVSSGGTAPVISLSAAHGDTLNPYGSKTANTFLAAPSGSAGVPAFRALTATDIPSLDAGKITTGAMAVARGGTGVDGSSQAQGLVLASPAAATGAIGLRALVATDIPSLDTSKLGSGTLAAARMPALTGDVTTTAGAVATTIASGVVTNAKLATMAARTIKGNNTAATATPSDLTAVQVQDMLGVGGNAFRNLLINPGFKINQRGKTAVSATYSWEYLYDRWQCAAYNAGALSFPVSGRSITFPSGGIVSLVRQVIEGSRIIGGTYVLKWTGSISATVNGTSVTNGGTISIAAGTQTTIEFAGNGTSLTDPSFELGSVAGPTEYRPDDIELLLCRRYYWVFVPNVIGANFANGAWGTATLAQLACEFPVPMRAAPTITGGGSWSLANGAVSWSCAFPTGINAVTTHGIGFSATASGGAAAAGQAAYLIAGAAAYVQFEAEL